MSTTLIHGDDNTEMMITRLPSWGDPILQADWRFSEDELNLKFPLPEISREACYPLKLLEDVHGCPLLKMPDPSQTIQTDIDYSCWKQDDSTNTTMADDWEDCSMDEDDRSSLSSRDDISDSSREEGTSSRDVPYSWSDSKHRPWSEDSLDDMEIESDDEVPTPNPTESLGFEWTIEAHYDVTQSMRFKLKPSSGAYMVLLEEEILDSIEAVLEEAPASFKIQPVGAPSCVVGCGQVISKVQDILDQEGRKRRYGLDDDDDDVRDEFEDEREMVVYTTRKMLKLPPFGRRRQPKESPQMSPSVESLTGKLPSRLSSAWRTMISGRPKMRTTKALARVE